MAQSVERSCTMLVHFDKPASASEIKEALEGNDPLAKVQALQKAIMMLLNGEQIPALFITIIRYVLPSEDHTIQKLLLLYLVRDPLTFYKQHFSTIAFPASSVYEFLCFRRKRLRRLMPMESFFPRW